MTVAAGFECDDGLLLCADTKITTQIKTNESKLLFNLYDGEVTGQYSTVFAVASDDFDLAKAAVREYEEGIGRINFGKTDIVGIRKSIEDSLTKFYKNHIFPAFPNPDSRVRMEFLVGICLAESRASMHLKKRYLTP